MLIRYRKSFLTAIHPHTYLFNRYHISTSSSTNNKLIQGLPINQYLKKNLADNNLFQLKQFQIQTFREIQNGNNCFVNSCTGSGKTLAYLLPVLNRLLAQKQQYKANTTSDTSNTPSSQQQSNTSTPHKHGAVILSLNKQLCLQIYRTIRLFDPQQKLNIKRAGPITHYIPIITQLSKQPKNEQQARIIDGKINKNLVNTMKWSKIDIVVATPQLLYNVMDMNRKEKDRICPQFIVIDQADLLLEIDKNVSGYTYKIIEKINGYSKQLAKQNKLNDQKIQYLISASSFPKKLNNLDYEQGLNTKFGPIKIIKGQAQHQIPPTIDLFFIQISKMPNNKLFYIQDILKSRQKQRGIIFCNNKKSVEEVSNMIAEKLKIQCESYHASLDSNQRSRALHRFQKGDASILVSTDLGSRGLDFNVPVNFVIEYEMADNVTGFINRVGRTGRNNVKGQVITMVSPQNQELFKHIQALVSSNEKLDPVFSRKRSYNKLYKDKQK